jgi:lambda family phage tail tape measure protein
MIDLQEANEQSFGYGAKAAMKSYVDEARKSAKMMQETFSGAFSRLEDSLVEFVKTGKFNFKDLADFIITELIRISIRQAVLAPVIGAIGGIFSSLAGGAATGGSTGGGSGNYSLGNSYQFANGGVMTNLGSMPLKTYARGGIANSPQMALFGEGSTPEAYVPLPDGRRIPVAMSGSSAGASAQVSVVVNMNGDSAEGDVQSSSKFGEGLGKAIVNVVRQELIVQKRPGGILA